MKPKGDGGVWGSYLLYMEQLEAVAAWAEAFINDPDESNHDRLLAALQDLAGLTDPDIDIPIPPHG